MPVFLNYDLKNPNEFLNNFTKNTREYLVCKYIHTVYIDIYCARTYIRTKRRVLNKIVHSYGSLEPLNLSFKYF
jgi:hypothetical protein